ncbi:MAG: RluA family pseudouridine synthase [Bacteroidia bacterium]|nr:RluA family pseudouridine synthase [Bacteroidia bacterium]
MNNEELYEELNDENAEQELFEHHRIVIDPGQQQIRIDKFLQNRLGGQISRTKIQAGAEAGNLLVNDKPVKSSYKIKPKDVITVLLPHPPKENYLVPEEMPLDIMYEDNEIIILNKQSGLVVHPGHGNLTGTLVNGLLWHFLHLPKADNDLRPGLVHRLDKDTTGVMVIAKSEYSLAFLARQFFERTNDRKYLALVWGDFETDSGTITGHLGRSAKDRRVQEVFPDGDQGRHAVTHWKVVERFGYVTLVECKLETGRTHQIRAHMKYIGHPLFNDAMYGGDVIRKGPSYSKYKQFVDNCFAICPRQALHARLLTIQHPITKEWMEFNSELPSDMQAVIEKWRGYVQNRPHETE